MNRTEKHVRISDLEKRAAAAPFILVTEMRGTKSGEANALRRDLEKSGMSFKVIKNTLAKRAFAQVGVTGLDLKLKGMTGFVFSTSDGIASARLLKDILKPFPTIVVRAGFFDGGVIEKDPIKVVGELPGREELFGMLLAAIQAGPQNLVSVIGAPARDLMQVLKNHELKLAESETAAA